MFLFAGKVTNGVIIIVSRIKMPYMTLCEVADTTF